MPKDKVREALVARGVAPHVIEGGLPRLVEKWEAVAAGLETGYRGTFDEWLNEMDGRDILALALSVAGEDDLRALGRRVRLADERVRARTTSSGACIWGSGNAARNGWTSGNQWWYFLVPKVMDRDFAHDVEKLR
jgi:hypothetical protein